MQFGRVTLVSGQLVLRIEPVQFQHLAVTLLLGQDRGGADTGLAQVTLDDGFDQVTLQVRFTVAIDLHQLRALTQRKHRALHRQHAGVQDIQLIDFLDAGLGHSPAQGFVMDFLFEQLTFFFAQLLGIGQAGDRLCRIQNHRGRDHRTGQRTTPGFIDACNKFRYLFICLIH